MKKQSRGFGLYLMTCMVILGIFMFISSRMQAGESYSYQEFQEALANNQIAAAEIAQGRSVPTGTVSVRLTSGEVKAFYVSDVKEVETLLRKAGVAYVMDDVPPESLISNVVMPVMVSIIAVILVMNVMMRSMGGGGSNGKMMDFGKSRARRSDDKDKKVTFEDVAGLDEEKEDLREVVDFLRDPGKYTRVGARIPKGVLLVGPPGTGKTLMARAVAGEAGVPFFTISGSDFVEMFVGVGASRVRDLFEEGKKNSPCIIFIDEIDAVARRRGTGMGGGHDEREQTLNQLLVEMDGFGINEGIIVMAATNRVDILDPAILRPGRFDRQVAIGAPDVKGREEILKVHAANKPLAEDVDLKQVAQTTAGFTGAELESLLNEAAILAAKKGRVFLIQEDIRSAFIKVGIGTEKKSRIISGKEKRITAFHETGHAILFHVLPDMDPVYTVSIIPTGRGAAGYTMPLPEKDELFDTRGKMLQHIMVCLGGRIAEELVLEDITTGASQDIKQATAIAKAMVTKYGMSRQMGLVAYGDESDEVFIGRDLAHSKGFSEATAASIDDEVRSIINDCYDKAKAIITEHEAVLYSCTQLLLEKERIDRTEFELIFQRTMHPELPVAEELPAAEDAFEEN